MSGPFLSRQMSPLLKISGICGVRRTVVLFGLTKLFSELVPSRLRCLVWCLVQHRLVWKAEGTGSGDTERPDSCGPSPSFLASQFLWGGLGRQERGVGWSR